MNTRREIRVVGETAWKKQKEGDSEHEEGQETVSMRKDRRQ